VITRANRVLAAIVGLVLVAAIVALVVGATRPATTLDPATPEGTVQSYVSAVLDRDPESAAALLASGGPCGERSFDRTWAPESVRIDLVDSSITGDRAVVDIDITMSGSGPLDNGWTERQTLRLVVEDGQWRITGVPWPLYECGGVTR
jgi:hypothetical protein